MLNKPFNKNVSILCIRQMSSERSKRFYIQGIPLPPSIQQSDINAEPTEEHPGKQPNALSKLSAYARKIHLTLINSDTGLTTNLIKSKTGIKSDGVIHRSKIELQSAGLVEITALQSGKNFFHIWTAEDLAFELCGITRPNSRCLGAGPVHVTFQKMVAETVSGQGAATVQIEKVLSNGTRPDISVNWGHCLEYWHISLPPFEKERTNILNAFDQKLESSEIPSKVVMLVKHNNDKKKLEALIDSSENIIPFREKVVVELVGKFITWKPKQEAGRKVMKQNASLKQSQL